LQRRDLEQHLALLHGRAELLGQIARHDEAGQRRAHLGAGEADARELALRLGLPDLGVEQRHLGAVVARERIAHRRPTVDARTDAAAAA
jgi:hypothetical protein